MEDERFNTLKKHTNLQSNEKITYTRPVDKEKTSSNSKQTESNNLQKSFITYIIA